MAVHVCQSQSPTPLVSTRVTPPHPSCVYMSLLYVCVSFLALYSGILPSHKKDQNWSFVETWTDLESVIQGGVGQKEKTKYHILIHVCGI